MWTLNVCYTNLRTKTDEGIIKKNNNLLAMNSYLTKENQVIVKKFDSFECRLIKLENLLLTEPFE